jgi:hypothetical protein
MKSKFSDEHVLSSINSQVNGRREWKDCPEHRVQNLKMTRAAMHEAIAKALGDMRVVPSGNSLSDIAYHVAKRIGMK